MAQSIAVEVKILQRDSLRTDVTAAEWIVFVAPNIQPSLAFDGDLDAADRLAEIAVAVMRTRLRHVLVNINSNSGKCGTIRRRG